MNDWILCSNRMPEEHDSMFKKFYGTDKWNNAMWKSNSNEVLVTIEFEDGTRKTEASHTNDGIWRIEKERKTFSCKVIAWQPLPEPCEGQVNKNE